MTSQDVFLSLLGAFLGWVGKGAFGFFRERQKLASLRTVFPIPAIPFLNHLFDYVADRPRTQLNVHCSLVKKEDGSSPPTFRAYVHSAEVLGLAELISKLSRLGVEVDVKLDQEVNRNVGTILIGSDANLAASGDILKGLPGIIWDRGPNRHTQIKWTQEGKEESLLCSHEATITFENKDGSLTTANRVTRDFGLIVRKQSQDDTDVLLLAGIHMYGTLAALVTALEDGFRNEVRKFNNRHFVKLVEANVAKNGLDLSSDPVRRSRFPLVPLIRKRA